MKTTSVLTKTIGCKAPFISVFKIDFVRQEQLQASLKKTGILIFF
jgi:hypothetical protein